LSLDILGKQRLKLVIKMNYLFQALFIHITHNHILLKLGAI